MLSKRLKFTRERKGMTQVELARLFGISSSTLSGWETKKDTIPFKYLIQYANEYHYSLDYLYGITNKNKEYESIEINPKEIGKNIKILRKIHGDSQRELAQKLNYSFSCICHYETGRTLVSTNFLYALSKKYNNYSIDELLGRKEKQKETTKVAI